MYEVVIVDDEIAVANMMAQHIAKLPGFHIAGTFYHGLAAQDFLINNHADILITDIRMPEFTGLDLAEFMARTMPNCAVILISAYSEFEYARRAISLGVLEYISKPIQFKQIDASLACVAHQIDLRRAEIIGEQELLTEESDLFFFDLVNGKLNDEGAFCKRFARLKAAFPLRGMPCCVVGIAFPAVQEKIEIMCEILKRILCKIAPMCHAHFLSTGNKGRIFLFFTDWRSPAGRTRNARAQTCDSSISEFGSQCCHVLYVPKCYRPDFLPGFSGNTGGTGNDD